MFERITAQLAEQALTEEELAGRLGMGREALRRKLGGQEPFTLDEAIRLKTALGSADSIETLFSSTKDGETLTGRMKP